ncbi:hypothetical protein J6590_019803, partial [Homalodisca vitripennis]
MVNNEMLYTTVLLCIRRRKWRWRGPKIKVGAKLWVTPTRVVVHLHVLRTLTALFQDTTLAITFYNSAIKELHRTESTLSLLTDNAF